MPINLKITGESKEKGLFIARGTVTAADGTEKGQALVGVRAVADGGQVELVVSESVKSSIIGAVPTKYISGHVTEQPVELAKGAEFVLGKVLFAI